MEGAAPLHVAAKGGHEAAVYALLHAAADVSPLSATGQTPLHLSCQERHLDVSKLLLTHGSDVSARDKQGLTPEDTARQHAPVGDPLLQLFVDPTIRFWNRVSRGHRLHKDSACQESALELYHVYGEAISILPKCAPVPTRDQVLLLYHRHAMAAHKCSRDVAALSSCDEALSLHDSYGAPLALRGECHASLKDFKQAVYSLEAASHLMELSEAQEELLANCRAKEAQSPHQVLCVVEDSTQEEIKQAYKQQCWLWHPDKHHQGAGEGEDSVAQAKNTFQAVQAAYEALSSGR
jgi:hypothetical protein